MHVGEMMQQEVVTGTPDMSLAQAQQRMQAHRIRHLPVLAGSHLVGLVSDRDLRHALPSPATTLHQSEIVSTMDTVCLKTCLTEHVITVSPETDAVQAARCLLHGQFGCLPVVACAQLVGIVTASDFLRGFLAAAAPAGEFMHVKDYMHTTPYTITQGDFVSTAYQRMRAAHIRHLPVVTAGRKLVGILTDRDLRQAQASNVSPLHEYERLEMLRRMTVKEVMTQRVITVGGDTPVSDAAQLLLKHRFDCLPVMSDDRMLLGIVTVTDLIGAYVQQHDAIR